MAGLERLAWPFPPEIEGPGVRRKMSQDPDSGPGSTVEATALQDSSVSLLFYKMKTVVFCQGCCEDRVR